MQKHRRGFTLTELLVVISILALLSSLLFTGMKTAMNMAATTRASSLINQVRVGLAAYNTEYDRWPYDLGTVSNDGPSNTMLSPSSAYTLLIGDPNQILAGTNCANPRQNVYQNFNASDLDNPDYKLATKFVDPWKVNGKRQDFYIAVDGNGTHQLGGIPDVNKSIPWKEPTLTPSLTTKEAAPATDSGTPGAAGPTETNPAAAANPTDGSKPSIPDTGATPPTDFTSAGLLKADGTTTINAECAMWSRGIPVNGAPNTNPRKFIHSW